MSFEMGGKEVMKHYGQRLLFTGAFEWKTLEVADCLCRRTAGVNGTAKTTFGIGLPLQNNIIQSAMPSCRELNCVIP